MKSSWPIVLGFVAVTVAAFAYDARNEAVAASAQVVIAPAVVPAPAVALATR